MDKELEILKIADYSEKVVMGEASAYLIVNKKMLDYQCMFGFVDFPNDLEKARRLFDELEKRAKELGYKSIVGPINYTTWLTYRWAIDNFDLKLYPDCDNPNYYPEIIKKLGYQELYTYRSATIDMNNELYYIGERVLKEKEKEGYTFEFVPSEKAHDKTKEIYNISIDAFAESPLYSEISYEIFEEIYLEWMQKIDPVAFIAYKDGEAVGFVMGYKNLYTNDFISKTSAVLKKYQKNNVYVALLYLGCKYVKELGFEKMLYHFQCEQKPTFKRFSGDVESNEKRYAVYTKELNS